jgi:hypothetical protein
VNGADAWLSARLDETPGELADRALEFLAAAPDQPLPDRLAEAGRLALARATEGGTGRGVALDLVAADALVTLALAAQVESAPSDLARFARRLRQSSENGA